MSEEYVVIDFTTETGHQIERILAAVSLYKALEVATDRHKALAQAVSVYDALENPGEVISDEVIIELAKAMDGGTPGELAVVLNDLVEEKGDLGPFFIETDEEPSMRLVESAERFLVTAIEIYRLIGRDTYGMGEMIMPAFIAALGDERAKEVETEAKKRAAEIVQKAAQ